MNWAGGMILSGTPNERHQQSPNLLIKIPVNEYFIYYAYLTPFLKFWNFSCDKNGLFPPEMTKSALDNQNVQMFCINF